MHANAHDRMTTTSWSDDQLAKIFRQRAANFARNRAVNLSLTIRFGEVGLRTQIRDGQVTAIDALSEIAPLVSTDFVIQAASHAWVKFWAPVPLAGSHDIFALTRHGQMVIQGNLHPLMSNLQFIKDLLAVGRGALQ